MKDEFPNGWVKTTLGEVCSKPQYGWTSKANRAGRVKYVRTTDISNGQLDWDDVPFCELEPDDIEKFRVHEDDILVSRAGSVGVSFRIRDVPCDAVFASYLIRFNPLDCVLPKYIEYFLNSHDYWSAISEFSAGIAVPNVNASKLAQLGIPVAPLNEQRRIVAKLEELLSRVNAAQARLASIPRILKRFRQSVLAAACSGRLTADWRVQQNGSKTNSVELTHEIGEIEIPTGWNWRKLPELGFLGRGRSKHRPRDTAHLYGGNYPFIQTGTIARSNGRITNHNQTYSEAGLAQSKLWQAGTVCITIAANIADSAILTYPACFPDSVVGFLADKETCLPEYAEFFLRTAREDLSQFAPATAQKNINLSILNEVMVPLPPLTEQKEIVCRVEALFKTADALEARYRTAKAYVDQLTQSILARAFRGELVPQDPNDEPASALLERIDQSRTSENRFRNRPKTTNSGV